MDGREGGADLAAEFDAFYTASAIRIMRQMALLTGDTAEAEDVTQEAFERAWARWSVMRDATSPEAWVRPPPDLVRRRAERSRRTRRALAGSAAAVLVVVLAVAVGAGSVVVWEPRPTNSLQSRRSRLGQLLTAACS